MDSKKVISLIKNANRIAKNGHQKSSSKTRNCLKRTRSTPNLLRCNSFSSANSIFSQGKILHAIQMSNLYQDSKTFVDMTARWPDDQVMSNFEKLGESPNIDDLKNFVNENFFDPGYDLVKVEPSDWHEIAPFMQNIKNEKALNFSKFLNCKWRTLLRNFDRSKLEHKGATTALCTKNSFIVPGGRFIEYCIKILFKFIEL
jgi:neutral trehalase